MLVSALRAQTNIFNITTHLLSVYYIQFGWDRKVIATMIAKAEKDSAVFHRSLTKQYPTAASGSGVWLIDNDGSRTLDGSSGAAVSCLGHGHQVVIDAIVEQAQKLDFAHTSFFTSDPAEELASLLLDQSDNAFSNVMFLSSGVQTIFEKKCACMLC